MTLGMRQHNLVADGGEDNCADQQQMDISVGEPPNAAGIVGLLDLFTATLRADIEINPPHSDAASECRDESSPRGPGPFELSERRAGDESGLAKRDDDEEAATFGEMAAFYGPVSRHRSPEPRHKEADGRPRIFDGERNSPQPEPWCGSREPAENPKQRRDREPDNDPLKVLGVCEPPGALKGP